MVQTHSCSGMWSTALKCVISTLLLYIAGISMILHLPEYLNREYFILCGAELFVGVFWEFLGTWGFFPSICLQFDHIKSISLYQKANEIRCFNMCNATQASDEIKSGREILFPPAFFLQIAAVVLLLL